MAVNFILQVSPATTPASQCQLQLEYVVIDWYQKNSPRLILERKSEQKHPQCHPKNATSRNTRARSGSRALTPSLLPVQQPSLATLITPDQFNNLIQQVYILVAAIQGMQQNNTIWQEMQPTPPRTTTFYHGPTILATFCGIPSSTIRVKAREKDEEKQASKFVLGMEVIAHSPF